MPCSRSKQPSRRLSYIALALFLGQFVAAGFLLPQGRAADAARVSLLLWARASLLRISLRGIARSADSRRKTSARFPFSRILWRYLTMTQSGKIWFAREVYGIALLLGIWLLRQKTQRNLICLVAVLALPLVAAPEPHESRRGSARRHYCRVDRRCDHLIATALWAGGLVALWRIFYLDRQNYLSAELIVKMVQAFFPPRLG